MRNLRILFIGAGLLSISTASLLAAKLESPVVVIENEDQGFDLASMDKLDVLHIHDLAELGWDVPSEETLAESASFKVAVYSVPLPAENKIVLVRDPKGFVERAIRHGMEFIAIKPMDKSEYWEIVPVFSTESSVSFKPDTVEQASDKEMEMLRTVPVKDFIRYN